MKVLLTGGSGFVGRALALRLRQDPNVHLRLAQRASSEQLTEDFFQIDDIAATTDWQPVVQGMDAIIHAAARVHVMKERSAAPLNAFRSINVDTTLRIAQRAMQASVKRFIFISTVKVLGETTVQPWRETDVFDPQDAYAHSKAEAEIKLRAMAASSQMEIVIIRPPLIYGPGVKANFAALMNAIERGIPLPLKMLHNRRSLVGLDNFVDFTLACLNHPVAANQTFLVSDGEDLSTRDLAYQLGLALERPARLLPVPPSLLLMAATALGKRAAAERLCGNLQVDISKARTLLKWTPPISVEEGMRRVAASH